MTRTPRSPSRRARILGPGLVVTLESACDSSRVRVRVRTREGRSLCVEPLLGSDVKPAWTPGTALELRAARPFGLFLYRAAVEGTSDEGFSLLRLDAAPARRRQLRHDFRTPVRLGVMLEVPPGDRPAPVLRVHNLSANGILISDPQGHLDAQATVRLRLPVGKAGEILRLPARVVWVHEGDPRRVGLCFDKISEGSRRMLLRYLVREHRRRGRRPSGAPAPVISIERT